MPYIITTIEAIPNSADVYADRHAVATLDEAREAVHVALGVPATAGTLDALLALRADADALSEDGGTIGPLPDGTVVEVEPVSWDHLTRDMPEYVTDENIDAFGDQIIDAYNKEHA